VATAKPDKADRYVPDAPVLHSPYTKVQQLEDLYRGAFQILGWPWSDSTIVNASLAITAMSGSQRKFGDGFTVTNEQRPDLIRVLQQAGAFNGMPLESGTYDKLLMQALSFPGTVAMLQNILPILGVRILEKDTAPGTYEVMHMWRPYVTCTFDEIYAVGGQRARSDKTDGTVDELYDSLSETVRNHWWVVDQMTDHVRGTQYAPYHGPFASEFELFMLAILVVTEGLADFFGQKRADDSALPRLDAVPARTIESYTVVLDCVAFKIINCPAERRGLGEPRATSKNNVKHLMTNYPFADGDVVVITGARLGVDRWLATSEASAHRINPTVTILGYAAPPDGTPEDNFVSALVEFMTLYVKAAEEWINRLLPAGAKPITSRDLNLILRRIREADDVGRVVRDVIYEIVHDTIVRAQ
jgi:hypothetical protein